MNLYYGTVTSSVTTYLWVRREPSVSSPGCGKLYAGDSMVITEIMTVGSDRWCKHDAGWSCCAKNGIQYIEIKEVASSSMNGRMRTAVKEKKNKKTKKAPATKTKKAKEGKNGDEAVKQKGAKKLASLLKSNTNKGAPLKRSMRLFGMPYQFLDYQDPRIESVSSEIGRMYINNIVIKAPVLTLMPGKPFFLPNKARSSTTLESLIGTASDYLTNLKKALSKNKADEQRWYDWKTDYMSYDAYVNGMCRTAAAYLNISTETIDQGSNAKPLGSYSWRNYRWDSTNYTESLSNAYSVATNKLKKTVTNVINGIKDVGEAIGILSGDSSGKSGNVEMSSDDDASSQSIVEALESVCANKNYVQFYIDPSSSFSEESSNSTTTSKMEQFTQGASDTAAEIGFLLDSGGGDTAKFTELTGNALDKISETITRMAGSSQIVGAFGKLTSLADNLAQGEKLIIPEIYNGSKYGKSYSINLKLRAIYGNKFSYYMDILVPLFHILALALPRQTTANTYKSPFILKGFLPGQFGCTLGIVNSVTINKNPSGSAWSVDGYPLELDVTINLTDLYSDLTVSPSNDIVGFINNVSLIDFIAINCGLDMITPNIQVKLESFFTKVQAEWTEDAWWATWAATAQSAISSAVSSARLSY